MRSQKLLTSTYLSAFCLEVSIFLRAGMTINDGLNMLKDDDNDHDSRELMSLLCALTEEGRPLSGALEESGVFPAYMIDMVALAEKAGKLENTMRGLSDYYERQRKLSLSIKNAVFYPILLVIIMVAVIAVLVIQVLPIFNDVFGQMGMQMSTFAVKIMMIGQAMSRASAAICVVAAIILAFVFSLLVMPSLRTRFFMFFKDNFGGKGIFKRISSARFAFAIAMATSSGIDADQSVALATKVCGGGKSFLAKSESCRKLLSEGARLGEALSSSGIFTLGNHRMISLAEQTGMLPETLETIAQRSEDAVLDEIDSLIGKIEPALVIITSIIVGLILMSVMLPLISIMSAIR